MVWVILILILYRIIPSRVVKQNPNLVKSRREGPLLSSWEGPTRANHSSLVTNDDGFCLKKKNVLWGDSRKGFTRNASCSQKHRDFHTFVTYREYVYIYMISRFAHMVFGINMYICFCSSVCHIHLSWWLDGCGSIDFSAEISLVCRVENFLSCHPG